ncbi:hypothetical protein D6O16_23155 [Salmonella enterica]|uniref:DUF3279 domain-containing protein n=1 Tax=Salmonella enterica subsp. enterica serovar Panama TaxID=29472 RepID=A0A751YWV1_SALET|nr:hypothetical protein [Salmonella enterica subsp. enterica serovar Sandiego]EAP1707821.1 hypothetical protein [Salmonella enterica]ECI5749326.1 hypothetical protein [Salmonella enterica subsp. enterica]EDX8941794.1 hypothetical protein [Salmonella enterica subsp. enterica serovar Aba]EGS7285518.1 hypothetical protein [Salmonella enterica subsp. enterica serovar Panama]
MIPLRFVITGGYLDPEVKAEARYRKLRNMLNGLDAMVMTLSWYCVWCGDHYQGVKHCYRCQTGKRMTSRAGVSGADESL